MREVIDKASTTEWHPVPLLFVHGACGTASVWDEHFLDFFADQDYRAVALSLRGHGASSLSKPLKSCFYCRLRGRRTRRCRQAGFSAGAHRSFDGLLGRTELS